MNKISLFFMGLALQFAFTGKLYSDQLKTPQKAGKTTNERVQKTPTLTPTSPIPTAPPAKNAKNIWKIKPIELPTTKGNTRSLSDWKGKVILLNFWASWCAPCQFEIPRFVKYQNKYAEKGLQIVGIGLDKQDKLKNVERSLEINYPTMVISQGKGASLLELFGDNQHIVPYTVVINKDGTIVYTHQGSLENEDFNDYIRPLLLVK